MSTTMIHGTDRIGRSKTRTWSPRTARTVRTGNGGCLRRVGVRLGRHLVPFVGPLFGYSADGSGSWHWDLAHSALGLAPGALGVVLGVFVVRQSRGIVAGKSRLSLATAGTLLMASGAWFAIGPLAWPLLTHSSGYFVPAAPSTLLAREIGYSIGTGLVLVFCGAFTDGWSSRHQPPAPALTEESSPATAS